jgi:hypothetical protein
MLWRLKRPSWMSKRFLLGETMRRGGLGPFGGSSSSSNRSLLSVIGSLEADSMVMSEVETRE